MMKKNIKNSKYNILLVHNFYKQKGGEDTVFENEKQMLIENGHNIMTYTRNNNEINHFNFFRKLILPFTTIFSFKTYFDIKKIIKDKKIDIIHVHNTLNLISPSIFYIAKRMKIPVIQTIHNFRMLCPNGLFYRDNHICEDCPNKGLGCAVKYNCYRNSKMQSIVITIMMRIHRLTKIYKYVNFIFLTEFNKNKFLEYNKKLKIFDEKKLFVKPNFIDDTILVPKVEKIDNQYIYVGRLEKSKGIKEVVEAWSEINEKRLIICGTGPLETELKEYSKKNKLNIEFKGFLKKEELFKNIAESKALIFASDLYEGFPMTLLESFMCNTPVISRNIGNASIIVDDEKGLKYDMKKDLIDIIKNDSIEKIYKINIFKYTKKENYKILNSIYDRIVI